MANLKISELTDGSTASSDDRIAVARNPGGSTTSRYITPAYVATYMDATNRTISGDWTFSSAALVQGTGTAVDAASTLGHGGGDGTLHVHTATAGAVTAGTDYDDLTVENSGNAGISVLGGVAGYSSIVFGDSGDNDIGYVKYNHGTGTDFMYIGANATDQISIDGPQNRIGLGTGSPDGKLHVFVSDCTATAVAGGDDLIIENDTNAGISIITHNDQNSSIYFGDEDDADVGSIIYDHGAGFGFTVETSKKVAIGPNGLAVDATGGLTGSASGVLLQARTANSSATVNSNANEIVAENSANCGISILSGTTSNGVLAFGSATDDDEGYLLYNHNTARMVFKVNGTERGMITDDGFLQMDPAGTFANAGNDYHVIRNANNLSGAVNTVLLNGGTNTNNTSSFLLSCSNGAADVAYIYGDGTATFAGGVATWSDSKLKKDIKNANSQWNDIKSLKMRSFSFKEGNSKKQLGLVAQEVETISPGLVFTAPRPGHGDIVKNINTSALSMKMLGALKEAMERIEELERKAK